MNAYTVIEWSALSQRQRDQVLARPAGGGADAALGEGVRNIIGQVRSGGDAALQALSLKFDGYDQAVRAVDGEVLDSALEALDEPLLAAIKDAQSRIFAFHKAGLPKDYSLETAPGVNCRMRYTPLRRVGLYVPGGTAPLLSTTLMLGTPAAIAGCEQVMLCSPGDKQGRIRPEILAAARLCGIDQVFALGGAQAIAAMAYGTESLPRCDKLFGPGNAWVTEAKQQVAADPEGAAIDLPAGPSEVMVVADAAADAELVAMDLLSQAEHGPDSQSILAATSETLIRKVAEQLQQWSQRLPRREILAQSLQHLRLILCTDLRQALDLANSYAPEHLILQLQQAQRWAAEVRHAGSVFVGPWTPESLGDYCSGTNHVLPTYGYARNHSGLGVADFMKRISFQQADPQGLLNLAATAETLAATEQLDAHRLAVALRRQRLQAGS